MKLWERVIERRLRKETQVTENQFGFMPGRSTMEAIYLLRRVMEQYRMAQQDLHLIFIDLEKAYDRVPREILWKALEKKGVRVAYIRAIQDMYDRVSTSVRTQGGESDDFPITIGLHQGSTLSPYLFTLILDVLTEQIQEIAPRCMLFADDIVLLGESREELNERLETWRRALETHGFRLSRSKSEYMECKFNKRRRVSNSEVKIGDHIIPQVTRFKYLGSVIQDDGEIEGDVNHRIQAGWMKWRKASGVLCDAKVPIKLKGKFYRTAVRPAILYGTECWAVKSQHENKVGVAEMRMLRWVCGKTRQDKIRNEAIRERVGVAPIVEKMVENRFRWFGHVERRPVDSVVRRVDQMERRQTIRGRGRPKKTIREVIKKDLEINGLDRSMMIMEQKFQPVIIFSFSRRECEQHAMSMSKLDFNTQEEKDTVEHVFRNAVLCLNEEDRCLPAIELMLPLLQRGIAVHHSGLLPVIKELVELLFQEGLVKALFATETFAMGLNMPAKTVIFTAVKKWDGDSHRYIGSGEYIQMSGRAGRCGKDERGICIIMIDEQMEMNNLKDMVLGKPAPLVSTFRLSYYSILNLMSRAEGQFTAEHVIRNSFHQFQYEKALPDIEKRVTKLEQEVALLDASGEAQVSEYHKLKLEIAQLEKKIMSKIMRPEIILYFLVPGRLIKVREGGTDWGWGVVVNVVKKPSGGGYMVDTLLHCSPVSNENSLRPKPCPPRPGEKGEMHVVPVQLPLISALGQLRVSIPPDLRPLEARQSILLADMDVRDSEIVELVNQVEELEKKLVAHPMHKHQDMDQIKCFERKAEVNHEVQQLKTKMRDSQLQKFREELKNRSRVLKKLGHIDADGVVQLKGRAACLIDTGDELLVTELMFNGTFNDLDHHQVAALASCFIPGDKSTEQIQLRTELARPLQQLQDSARRIAEIQHECKLDINVNEYVESTVRPFLMDVIYSWSKGANFADVIQMTDIFEGSIIRSARRLDEFLNQLRAAANAVGEADLEKKFAAASESLRRGIMFANSLYL
ncbi:DExH-box ATP-dependent RNA helicase DExH10 [Glycine soja]|uniref:DExH-box ATP-dependent RNA helicase DExH10 n=1 Tax=Glycine soja TaxID=3848 RepID=A0A445KS29_GLYSO|nr:DExH-box ATP-dependent RNA helicase DExH10 [Glycine soja]